MHLAKPSFHAAFFVTALGLAGCFSLAEYPEPKSLAVSEPDADGVRRLHHEAIAEGSHSPLGGAAFAIHDWHEWTAVKQHLRIAWDDEPDLDRSTVIHVAMPFPASGYRLRVDSVYTEGGLLSKRGTRLVGGNVVVAYTIEEPGDDCFVRPAPATPYAVLVVGVTFDQEVLFTETRETYSCIG